MKSTRKRLGDEFGFIKGNLKVIMLSSLLFGFGWNVRWTYESLLLSGLGASPTQIGLLSSLSSTISLLVLLPGAYYADKYSRVDVIKAVNFTEPALFFFLGLAMDWRIASIGIIIYALGSVCSPSWDAIFDDSVAPHKRAMAYNIRRTLSSTISIGAPILATYLLTVTDETRGIKIIFLIAFVLSSAAAMYSHFSYEEDENARKFRLNDIHDLVKGSITPLTGIREYLTDNLAWLLSVLMISAFQGTIWQSFGSIYSVDILGFTAAQLSVLVVIHNIVALLAGFPVTNVIERLGNRNALFLALFISLPIEILSIFVANFRLRILLVITSAISGPLYNALWALRADLSPKENRGKISGISSVLTTMARIPAGAVSGFLYEYEPRAPFFLYAALTVLNLLIMKFRVKEPEIKHV